MLCYKFRINILTEPKKIHPTRLRLYEKILIFLSNGWNYTTNSAEPRVYLGIPFTRFTVNLD